MRATAWTNLIFVGVIAFVSADRRHLRVRLPARSTAAALRTGHRAAERLNELMGVRRVAVILCVFFLVGAVVPRR